MQLIFEKLFSSIEASDKADKTSTLIFIASLTNSNLQPLEVEILSKTCASIYKNFFHNDFNTFKGLFNKKIVIESHSFSVYNESLWQAIWINAIKEMDFLQLKIKNTPKEDHTDVLNWCLNFILNNINILDKHTLYLLRTLSLLLNRRDLLTSNLSYSVIKLMSKVALSPHHGFRQLALNISKTALQFITPLQKYEMCCISYLPVKYIDTSLAVECLPDNYIKENIENIVKKVLMMFSNNIENKDGGFLYEKVLICTFEEWIILVWPLFKSKLQVIEYEGEFFQSLIKYWIPLNISAYKTDFYSFIKRQSIDLNLKACVLLESRRKGYLFPNENIFNTLEIGHLGLSIASTYKKKSLCPIVEDINFFISYLYSNLKPYLEYEEIDCVERMLSQIAFVAHSELKKSHTNFNFYSDVFTKLCKFCSNSLHTDYFEVGAQIIHSLLDIFKGSHSDLKLIYKLEKKDYYDKGTNLLYIKLKNEGIWKFDDEIYHQIRDCLLRIDCSSLILTNLIIHHYSYFLMTPEMVKLILNKVELLPNLQNIEKIANSSNLLFLKNCLENNLFVKEIQINLLKIFTDKMNEEYLFKNILHLEILTIAKKKKIKLEHFEEIINGNLNLIDQILDSGVLNNIPYRFNKVVETLITKIIYLVAQNVNEVWIFLDRKHAINILMKIVQKSNMKKPVSLSMELLRQFGGKLEEDEPGRILKMLLLNDTLDAINYVLTKHSKIRRNPESRLVIHAMCVSEKNQEKQHLHWTMNYLLQTISDSGTSDLSISSCLHTIELLVSDNRLQQQTLGYIPRVLTQSVELFIRSNWVVRNANLQLTKVLIERLYGVSINNYYRPKNVADLFVVYPTISKYFFQVLSSEVLDDRAIIVYQFFSESYLRESLLDDAISEIIDYFKVLLMDILKNYENHYGKLAVKSFVSIQQPHCIPSVFIDIISYLMCKFVEIPKNIFANLIQVLEELYEKYKNTFEGQINVEDLQSMSLKWDELTQYLKQFDTNLFNYILVKVKSVDDVINERNFSDRFWVHNNMTYFFLNGNSSEISRLLNNFYNVPEFFQVKMLSILIKRFENNEFVSNDLERITSNLLQVALLVNDNSYYLLSCYYKFLIIFMRYIDIKLNFEPMEGSSLYKKLIQLIYLSKWSVNCNDFFVSLINDIKEQISMNEDTDIDLVNAMELLFPLVTKESLADVLKIILYYSLLNSTSKEAYKIICSLMNKNYSSLLSALNNFYSFDNLKYLLKDERVIKGFYVDVNKFLNNIDVKVDSDEFYVVESERSISIDFVKKIFSCKKCYIEKIKNKG